MNSSPILKRLQTLYMALLTGQVLFLVIAIVLRVQRLFTQQAAQHIDRILQVVAVVLAVVCFLGGARLYHQKITAIRNSSDTVADKLRYYTSASILRWAIAEAPVLFSIAGYIITGNWAFIVLAAIMLFFFAGYAPSKMRIQNETGISGEDL
jgi:hypothetical protein